MLSSRPTLRQTLAVIGVSVATSAILYSAWFNDCCMDCVGDILMILTFPAFLIAILLAGGSVHGGSELNYYVGVTVQFYILFWFFRWVAQIMGNSR